MALILDLSGSRAVQLGNEDFARTMFIGNNWQKIRFAIRYSIDNVAAGITAKMALGVCDGTTYTYANANCTDFLGLEIPSGTWTGNATGYYSQAYSKVCDSIRKVGASVTRTAGAASTGVYWNGTSSIISMMTFQITRKWPLYDLRLSYSYHTSTAMLAVSQYTMGLYQQAENGIGPADSTISFSTILPAVLSTIRFVSIGT